jgi:probable phosphoglycerate mutase
MFVCHHWPGRWQVKHADMRELAKKCRDAHPGTLVTYKWIPRDENSHADRLANKALDGGQANEPMVAVQENYLTDRLRSNEDPTMIYFVRHGETILTPMRKFSGTGPLNPELTEEGLSQAATVAQEIAKIKPDVLIASPLQRTRQTAEAIAKETGLPIVFDEIWYELSFGNWDGLTNDEVREKYPEDYQGWLNSSAFKPGGGESYDQARIRVEAAMEKVCVVTHNGVIKSAVSVALHAPHDAVFHMDATPCSITSISMWPSDGLRALRSFSERGHFR